MQKYSNSQSVMANHNSHLDEMESQLREGSLGMPKADYPEKAEVKSLGHCGQHHSLSLVLGYIDSDWPVQVLLPCLHHDGLHLLAMSRK